MRFNILRTGLEAGVLLGLFMLLLMNQKLMAEEANRISFAISPSMDSPQKHPESAW